MNKRVFSLALASALAVSMMAPTFAADTPPANTTVVTGTYQDVEIAVDVPTTGTAFINPYGLDIKVPEDAADTGNANKITISGQQIVTAPMAIKNKSAMNLQVNATVTGEVVALTGEGAVAMKLATNTTKGVGSNPDAEGYVPPATGKSAFVYLQAKSAADLTGNAATVNAAAIAAKYAAWVASDYNADTDVVVGTRAASKENIVTLRAAKMDAAGAFEEFKAGSIALVRLAGDCVMSPTAAWTEDDSFKATIAYSFVPAQITKYDVTIGTVTGGSVTADVATAAEGDTVTLTATADNTGENPTYTVTGAVSGDTVTVTNGKFVMPAEAVTVTAVFA